MNNILQLESNQFRTAFKPDIQNGYLNLLSGSYYFNFNVYKKFLQVSNYFIGLFENKNENEEFERVETTFFKWLWTYGELFVTKINNEYQFWCVNKKECDGINVKKVTCQLIYENYTYTTPNNLKMVNFVNGVDGVYVTWNRANIYPAVVLWWDYISQIVMLENIFINNTIWDNKKFIYFKNNNDNDIVNEELKEIMNPNTPFIKSISPITISGKGGLSQNVFQTFDVGSSKAKEAYDNLTNYVNYVFNCMGIQAQQNMKKERKTMSESQMDLYNTINIENITLRSLKMFAKDMKKLYGDELDFERVTEITDITENEVFGSNNKDEI